MSINARPTVKSQPAARFPGLICLAAVALCLASVQPARAAYNQPILLTSNLPNANTYGFVYVQIDDSAVVKTIATNAVYLQYDVFIPTQSSSTYCGLEITGLNPADAGGQTSMRDWNLSTLNYIIDQNGLRSHPSTDLGAYARGQWYHRSLNISSLAGHTYTGMFLALDTGNATNGQACNSAGTFNAYFDNIQFTDAIGNVVSPGVIFADDNTLPRGGVMSQCNAIVTGDSWLGGTVSPTSNYCYVTKDFTVWANPADNLLANNTAVSFLSVTMLAADDTTPVTNVLTNFTTDWPGEDTVNFGYTAPNPVPMTNAAGLVTATVKSTMAGISTVTYQAGPFIQYYEVNFVAGPATAVVLIPPEVDTPINQNAAWSVQVQDAYGNVASSYAGVTVTSTSGTMLFTPDGSANFYSVCRLPAVGPARSWSRPPRSSTCG